MVELRKEGTQRTHRGDHGAGWRQQRGVTAKVGKSSPDPLAEQQDSQQESVAVVSEATEFVAVVSEATEAFESLALLVPPAQIGAPCTSLLAAEEYAIPLAAEGTLPREGRFRRCGCAGAANSDVHTRAMFHGVCCGQQITRR